MPASHERVRNRLETPRGFVRPRAATFKKCQGSPSRMVPIACFAERYQAFGKRWRKKRRRAEVARAGRTWQRTLPNRAVDDVTALTRTELACVSERQYSEQMPTVLRVGGFRFHFYSDEGTEPPHIHVRCAEGECKFWLDPVGLARNRGVPPHVVREMERLVFEHVDLLLEKYDEHHPSGNRNRSDESVD